MRQLAEHVRITTAAPSRFERSRARERRYLRQMGIRMLCILLALIIDQQSVRIALIILAAVLPLIAVIGANEEPAPPAEADLREAAAYRHQLTAREEA